MAAIGAAGGEAVALRVANEAGEGGDEERMGSGSSGTDEFDAAFFSDPGGFVVQVVEDFHVIGEETDRDDYQFGSCIPADVISDVGIEPGLCGWSTAALESQGRLAQSYSFVDLRRGRW